MKVFITTILAGVLLFASNAKESAAMLGAEHNYSQAIEKAQKGDKMVVMVIVKKHCRWCEKLIARTLAAPQVRSALEKDYVTLIVDKDDAYPAIFKEDFFPSIFYIDAKTQKCVYENVGYVGTKCFLNDLRGALQTRNDLYGD